MTRAGIYIHIPFCRSRCSYCDFATGAYETALAERYVEAVVSEMERFDARGAGREVETIYLGGGTPSLLSPAQAERILEAVRARFHLAESAEVTMEMNPASVTPAALREFRRLGINRASFGAQTFDDAALRRLGRQHTARDVRQTIEDLRRAEFDNVSFDLIAGLPAQTFEDWSRNLDEALTLRPQHLSLYLLEVHEGTPLAEQIRRGAEPRPDDDLAAVMYELMIEKACAVGYEHYEISNFCLPGYESRHNTKYWTGEAVYGFGCSAHSYDGARRRWANERDTLRYCELIEAGRTSVVETIELDESDAESEAVFLGLRLLRRGVSLSQYSARFRVDLSARHADDLARLQDAGLISLEGGVLRLTRHGALLSNEVFAAFI